MSPTKDEGSSCCKGKKVTVNDPLAKIVGEEASLSESDHFGEEKQGRNLNSEFPPLIDLWYDAHIHFLWCPVTIRFRRRAMCGFLFTAVPQRFLGPFWLPPFLILIYAKGRCFLCPISLSLGRILLWVRRSRWTMSCLTWVSWWHYSRLEC